MQHLTGCKLNMQSLTIKGIVASTLAKIKKIKIQTWPKNHSELRARFLAKRSKGMQEENPLESKGAESPCKSWKNSHSFA